MKGRFAVVISTLAMIGVSGCSTMSAQECAVSDWRTIGYEDGSMGYGADRLGSHRKACAKHGVAPDLEEYQAGRRDGLRQYCQPSRGFNVGAGGGNYNGVCPSDLEPDFVDAFNSGHRLYNLRSNVNATTGRINARKAALEHKEDRVRDVEAALIASETTAEQRVILLVELKELSEEIGEIETEIVQLVEDRAVYEQQLAAYEATLADANY